jgi:hypothetical protein
MTGTTGPISAPSRSSGCARGRRRIARPACLCWSRPVSCGKAHTPEEIVAKLRQVEVLVGQG